MIAIGNHSDGLIVTIRAHPAARRAGVLGVYDGALKVAVTAAPNRGKANTELLALLCKSLHLKRSQIELLSGQTKRAKKILIRGLSRDDLARALSSILDS